MTKVWNRKALSALQLAQDQITRDGEIITEDGADKSYRQETLNQVASAIVHLKIEVEA